MMKKQFSKPFRKDDGDNAKPFKAGKKPSFKAEGRDGNDSFKKRSDDTSRPYKKRTDGDENGERRSFGDKKPSFNRFGDKRADGDNKKPFERRNRPDGESKPFRERKTEGESRPFRERKSDNDGKPFRGRNADGESKPFRERKTDGESRPFRERKFDNESKPYRGKNTDGESRPFRERKSDGDSKPFRGRDADGESKPFRERKSDGAPRKGYERSGEGRFNDGQDKPYGRKPFTSKSGEKKSFPARDRDDSADTGKVRKTDYNRKKLVEVEDEAEYYGDNAEWVNPKNTKAKPIAEAAEFPMPLNKFIAHSGECSRRDAAELVKQGKAKVNGELIVDPGHKVNKGDQVTVSGKKMALQKGLVYILLNKPKGFITTNDDEKGRKTVMDLLGNSGIKERLFPVGRLDRATTGLLLITNDGVLAQKLSHPSHKIKKVYHVTLDKNLSQADFDKIMEGLKLDDGDAIVDEMAYLEKKNEVGLEIHSGKNRIVRRIFESLGYVVEKLDRMMYAGLTKKNLPRGKWRMLDEKEIILLKHFKS